MPQTGTISDYRSDNFGANIYVKPTVKLIAAQGAWQVDYSVNVNLAMAQSFVGGNFAPAVEDELNANIARYNGKPWYQMRYANTHGSSTADCARENPAAYNSELVGGTGWYRSFRVAPGEATCLTVWMYGDNIFSPRGTAYNGGHPLPMGVAYFVVPAAP